MGIKNFRYNGFWVTFISSGGPLNTSDYRVEKFGDSKRIKHMPNGEFTSTCNDHTQEHIDAVKALIAAEHADYLAWLEANPKYKEFAA